MSPHTPTFSNGSQAKIALTAGVASTTGASPASPLTNPAHPIHTKLTFDFGLAQVYT